jgi:hypothetical protein
MAVGSLLHEFRIEETNGNKWNVLGHGGHGGYGHGNVRDYQIGRCGSARSIGCTWYGLTRWFGSLAVSFLAIVGTISGGTTLHSASSAIICSC